MQVSGASSLTVPSREEKYTKFPFFTHLNHKASFSLNAVSFSLTITVVSLLSCRQGLSSLSVVNTSHKVKHQNNQPGLVAVRGEIVQFIVALDIRSRDSHFTSVMLKNTVMLSKINNKTKITVNNIRRWPLFGYINAMKTQLEKK